MTEEKKENKMSIQNRIIYEQEDTIEEKLKGIDDNNHLLAKEIRNQTSMKSNEEMRDLINKILEEKGLS